jgi:hypothetical protein
MGALNRLSELIKCRCEPDGGECEKCSAFGVVQDELDRLTLEVEAQCLLNAKGAQRESDLIGKVGRLAREVERLTKEATDRDAMLEVAQSIVTASLNTQDRLRELLREATDDLEDWASYAPEYFNMHATGVAL